MGKWHIKSQGAMEFMVLASILLFVFVVMMGIVSDNTSHKLKKKDIIIGEDIATKIQKEINLAARVADGYYRNFNLPAKLSDKNYTILIIGNEVILRTEKQDFWRVIPPIVGNITKGKNTINKTNGIIYLN